MNKLKKVYNYIESKPKTMYNISIKTRQRGAYIMARIDKVKIPEIQKIGIYAIHNKENEKYYIGSSVNVFKRMKQQKSAIKNYGLNSKILKDMFSKNFDVEFLILETFEDDTITDEQLRKLEWEYIQKYDSIKAGYNTSVPFPTGKYKGLLKCNVVKKTGKNRK